MVWSPLRAIYFDVMKGCKFSEPCLLVLVIYVDTLFTLSLPPLIHLSTLTPAFALFQK